MTCDVPVRQQATELARFSMLPTDTPTEVDEDTGPWVSPPKQPEWIGTELRDPSPALCDAWWLDEEWLRLFTPWKISLCSVVNGRDLIIHTPRYKSNGSSASHPYWHRMVMRGTPCQASIL